MKLSIIIPVYNVERYVIRCLESVAMEMDDDCELILVDDGSTDASGALCEHFSNSHSHLSIVVIHQPNGGPSAARNHGLEVAKGKYVTFVDADDYVDPQSISMNMNFLMAHPEVDMLEYPVEVHAGSPQAYLESFLDETLTADIYVDWIRREGYKHCYPCNKIFSAVLWSDLRFPVGRYFEDTEVMPKVLKRCRCVHYSSRGCYRYILRPSSNTTSYRYDKQRMLFADNYRLYQEIRDNVSLQADALKLWLCCLNQLVDMGRCADVDRVDYRHTIAEAAQSSPSCFALFRAAPDMSTHIKMLLLSLLGLSAYCRLYVTFTSTLPV